MTLPFHAKLNALLSPLLRALGMGAASSRQTGGSDYPLVRFQRDRYDAGDLIRQFTQQKPRLVFGAWEWELETEQGEVGIILPDASGSASSEAQAYLIEVLRCVRELDNLVQESCELECARTQLSPASYELAIGWVCIDHENLIEQTLVLNYYGVRVNTSWDAKFKRDAAGAWRPVNFLQQAADSKREECLP